MVRVRCIDNNGVQPFLTLGKEYDANDGECKFYGVIDDYKGFRKYHRWRFELVENNEKESGNKMKLADVLKVVNTSQPIRIGYSHTGEVFYPGYSELKNLEEFEVVDIESKDSFLEITINPTTV